MNRVDESIPPPSVACPGCGTQVETPRVDAGLSVADVKRRPVQLGKCAAVGIAIGLAVGRLVPHTLEGEVALAAMLGGLALWAGVRYNARVHAQPIDEWPTSVTCPRCGRVFLRYAEGADPNMPVWP